MGAAIRRGARWRREIFSALHSGRSQITPAPRRRANPSSALTINRVGKQIPRRQAGLREETTRKALCHCGQNRGGSQNGSQNIVWFPKTHSYLGTGIPLSRKAFRAFFGAVPKVPNGFAPPQMLKHCIHLPNGSRGAGGTDVRTPRKWIGEGDTFQKAGIKAGTKWRPSPPYLALARVSCIYRGLTSKQTAPLSAGWIRRATKNEPRKACVPAGLSVSGDGPSLVPSHRKFIHHARPPSPARPRVRSTPALR